MHPVWSASQPNSIRALLIPSMQGIPWSVDRLGQFGIETLGLNLTRRHFAGGARHCAWPPAYAFGDHYAALGRYDCANRRGTTYTDGVALI
jgi:hypothetical protein